MGSTDAILLADSEENMMADFEDSRLKTDYYRHLEAPLKIYKENSVNVHHPIVHLNEAIDKYNKERICRIMTNELDDEQKRILARIGKYWNKEGYSYNYVYKGIPFGPVKFRQFATKFYQSILHYEQEVMDRFKELGINQVSRKVRFGYDEALARGNPDSTGHWDKILKDNLGKKSQRTGKNILFFYYYEEVFGKSVVDWSPRFSGFSRKGKEKKTDYKIFGIQLNDPFEPSSEKDENFLADCFNIAID